MHRRANRWDFGCCWNFCTECRTFRAVCFVAIYIFVSRRKGWARWREGGPSLSGNSFEIVPSLFTLRNIFFETLFWLSFLDFTYKLLTVCCRPCFTLCRGVISPCWKPCSRTLLRSFIRVFTEDSCSVRRSSVHFLRGSRRNRCLSIMTGSAAFCNQRSFLWGVNGSPSSFTIFRCLFP